MAKEKRTPTRDEIKKKRDDNLKLLYSRIPALSFAHGTFERRDYGERGVDLGEVAYTEALSSGDIHTNDLVAGSLRQSEEEALERGVYFGGSIDSRRVIAMGRGAERFALDSVYVGDVADLIGAKIPGAYRTMLMSDLKMADAKRYMALMEGYMTRVHGPILRDAQEKIEARAKSLVEKIFSAEANKE